MAIPITTAGNLTGIPAESLAAVIGRQSPLLALFVPQLLLFLVDGWRGLRQLWPIALATGAVFALAQFWCSAHFAYELTDVVAALAGFGAAVVMLRFWTPTTPDDQRSQVTAEPLTRRRTFLAVLPYLLVIAVFALAKLDIGGLDIPGLLGSSPSSSTGPASTATSSPPTARPPAAPSTNWRSWPIPAPCCCSPGSW